MLLLARDGIDPVVQRMTQPHGLPEAARPPCEVARRRAPKRKGGTATGGRGLSTRHDLAGPEQHAVALPSGPHTTFTHEWMPWLRYTYRCPGSPHMVELRAVRPMRAWEPGSGIPPVPCP